MQYFSFKNFGFTRKKAFGSMCKAIALDNQTILMKLKSKEDDHYEIIVTQNNSQFARFCKTLDQIKDFRAKIIFDLDPDEYEYIVEELCESSSDDNVDDEEEEEEEDYYSDSTSSNEGGVSDLNSFINSVGNIFISDDKKNPNIMNGLNRYNNKDIEEGALKDNSSPVPNELRSRRIVPKTEFLEVITTTNANSNNNINQDWIKIENIYIYEIFKLWKTLKLMDKNLIDLISKDSLTTTTSNGIPNSYLISSKVDQEKIQSIKEWLNTNYTSVLSYSCSIDEYVNQSSKLFEFINTIADKLTGLKVNPEIVNDLDNINVNSKIIEEQKSEYKALADEMKIQLESTTKQCNVIGLEIKENMKSFNEVYEKIKINEKELYLNKDKFQ